MTMEATVEDSSVGHLEEQAIKRRQRLAELRSKRKQTDDDTEMDQIVQQKAQLPKPKFRSYTPSDEKLKENTLPKTKPESVSEQLSSEMDSSNQMLIDDIDLTKLAPKKIDWDLKRNIAKKLEKLERKTQVAIAELIRERLKSDGIDNLDKATEDLESANKNIDEDED